MKKALKTLAKLTLPVMIALTSMANSQDRFSAKLNPTSGVAGKVLQPLKEESTVKSKLADIAKNLEFEVGASYEQFSKNPRDFSKDNNAFRNGDYTYGDPYDGKNGNPEWRDINSNSFATTGAEASVLYTIGKGYKVGITGGYKTGSNTINYNENYDYPDISGWSPTGFIPLNFQRIENFDVSAPSIGIKAKKNFWKNFSASLTGLLEFYKINGKVDYIMNGNSNTFIRGPPWPYTQWRNATYSGSGNITSIEAGIDWNFWKNLSFGVSGGQKWGNVETSGKEIKTASSNPGKSWEYNYSPEFDFTSTFANARIKLKF